uniref:Bone morphogenetic protein receptor type-1b isoform x3 n=1 Tax=Triatoma infestans TaxID=30076 RepID=A0A170X249_TRIIF
MLLITDYHECGSFI